MPSAKGEPWLPRSNQRSPTLQPQQIRLGLQASREAGEGAACPDYAVAGGDDRDRVAAVGGAHRPRRGGAAERAGDLSVAARLAERYRQQRVPHALLEIGAPEIQRQIEGLAPPREIIGELRLGLDQDRMTGVFDHRAELHAQRIVVRPEDRNETLFAGDQRQQPDRRRTDREGVGHGRSFRLCVTRIKQDAAGTASRRLRSNQRGRRPAQPCP